ncbi:bisanhydrobacterioruberin hydratase CruF [Methanobacterium sp. ACI-7]|uniref:bisanhydrobacterioruberin hydratase CruF n=1 Tax=unclassified Methanobacterium TaxID=2627676 RepID=UPI0039C2C466
MKDYSKIFWITAVILIVVAFFVANVEITPELSGVSVIFIISMALSSYIALFAWLDWKKALIFLIILSVFALAIETFAIITGIPYSKFTYTNLIGFKLFGYTPFTVPFSFVPLFIGSLYIASLKATNKWKIAALTAVIVLIADLVLDPAAVALNFWIWDMNGFFYGVPLMNFIGWLITGFIAGLISVAVLGDKVKDKNKPKAMLSSLFLIISFWGAVCIYMGLYIPGIIGIIFLIYMLKETDGKIGEF